MAYGSSLAAKFIDACRRDVVQIDYSEFENIDIENPLEAINLPGGKASDTDHILKVVSGDKLVEMYILPKALECWPSFYATNQRNAADKLLFFHRVSGTHKIRFDATVQFLREEDQVVCTGLAGVGKSTELNAYLMEFLRHIGDEGWPPEVWYRYNTTLLKYAVENGVPRVQKLSGVSVRID
jgi:hypothetical protein